MTRPERRPDPAIPAAGTESLRISGRRGWDQHPGVRTGPRLGRGERAADVASRVAGSWAYLALVAIGVVVGVAMALSHDRHAGDLVVLGVGLTALAVLEVTLALVAARRAERIATELALYHVDQARRAAAVAADLRGEMQRLHTDVARIAAYTEKAGHPGPHP